MMIIVYNIQALSGCSADGSVLGSGPRGREFKSRHSDHVAADVISSAAIFYFSNPLRNGCKFGMIDIPIFSITEESI